MAGAIVVPDASVILKWALPGPDEEGLEPSLALKAAWLAGTVEVVVPTLWVFEVGNVLGLKQPAKAEPLLAGLIDLLIPEAPPASYSSAIFRLMRRYGVTFYDAAYHALAITQNGMMLTADKQYVTRSRAAGHLRLVTEWQIG